MRRDRGASGRFFRSVDEANLARPICFASRTAFNLMNGLITSAATRFAVQALDPFDGVAGSLVIKKYVHFHGLHV